ncbi:MAG: hypothetical protein COB54_04725 [Alphaproteobacteria bacterium]|nr:MAG: hypothetical protein COB54_04725 [Alphaproteobacteria bacterium]
MKEGCYFLQFKPLNSTWSHFNGTLRVERHQSGVTASGDLYYHPKFYFKKSRLVKNQDPSPRCGIPIFKRNKYRYYLSINKILEGITFGNSFKLGFDLYKYDPTNHSWGPKIVRKAKMVFETPPDNYPADAKYLEGDLRDENGNRLGRITMGWVSKYLRKATVEVDRYKASPQPADNGTDVSWRSVFKTVKWDMNAYESDPNVKEPNGESWSNAELHKKMIQRRDRRDLDSRWRYHLLCVRRLDATSRGIMFDAFATDSNNIPREGAAIASHWKIPNDEKWGDVRNRLFGDTPTAYFRTAVHEIGHAMGLYHNALDEGFMNTTGVIADSPGTFPHNIQWSFNGKDEKWLKHAPDPWVRPGMVPFEVARNVQVISPEDEAVILETLTVDVSPLAKTVPLGAPVRVRLKVNNPTDHAIPFPESISLSSGIVSGRVRDPSGAERSYRSLVICADQDKLIDIQPHETISRDMTLLRGNEGALFQVAGAHEIHVDLAWEIDNMPVKLEATTRVMVSPALDQAHAEAAMEVLACPDLLLTLALGGDHITEGIAALDKVLKNEVLAPYYKIIEAKRLGNLKGQRTPNFVKAAKLIDKNTIMTGNEAEHLQGALSKVDKKTEKDPAIRDAKTILATCLVKKYAKDRAAE